MTPLGGLRRQLPLGEGSLYCSPVPDTNAEHGVSDSAIATLQHHSGESREDEEEPTVR